MNHALTITFLILGGIMAFYDARDRSVPIVLGILLLGLSVFKLWQNFDPLILLIIMALGVFSYGARRIIQPVDVLFVGCACLNINPSHIPAYLIGCGLAVLFWYLFQKNRKQPAITLFFGVFCIVKYIL